MKVRCGSFCIGLTFLISRQAVGFYASTRPVPAAVVKVRFSRIAYLLMGVFTDASILLHLASLCDELFQNAVRIWIYSQWYTI